MGWQSEKLRLAWEASENRERDTRHRSANVLMDNQWTLIVCLLYCSSFILVRKMLFMLFLEMLPPDQRAPKQTSPGSRHPVFTPILLAQQRVANDFDAKTPWPTITKPPLFPPFTTIHHNRQSIPKFTLGRSSDRCEATKPIFCDFCRLTAFLQAPVISQIPG